MKILLVSPLPPPVGGISTWTVNVLNFLSDNPKGFEIIHQNTALKLMPITEEGIWSRVYFGIRESLRIISELKKNIKKYSPTIIHLTSSASLALIKDYFILKIAERNKIPVIIHWHFGRIPSLSKLCNWEWRLLCIIIRKSQKAIVIDAKSFSTLISAGFTNVLNIPNPIGLDVELRAKELKEQSTTKQQGRITYVGHIVREKGVFDLVKACLQVPEIKELLLIGPYEKAKGKDLQALAMSKKNGVWLKLLGSMDQDQVLDNMKKSQILLLPSYSEGFPYVIIEAMAMGCAVIATDVGAIADMLGISTEIPGGICVPVRNIEKLRDAITSLIKDPSKTEIMGRNGIERVLNNYTLDKVMNHYISVWENVVDISLSDFASKQNQQSQ